MISKCIYPDRGSCKGCEHSIDPTLYDGGCKLMYPERQKDERSKSSGNTSK